MGERTSACDGMEDLRGCVSTHEEWGVGWGVRVGTLSLVAVDIAGGAVGEGGEA